jgi:hypothetical protein
MSPHVNVPTFLDQLLLAAVEAFNYKFKVNLKKVSAGKNDKKLYRFERPPAEA